MKFIGRKLKKKQRNIATAVVPSRERLKSANHKIRIHTSGGKRNMNILGYSFENKARRHNSPSKFLNKSQVQLSKMLDYQIAQEAVKY